MKMASLGVGRLKKLSVLTSYRTNLRTLNPTIFFVVWHYGFAACCGRFDSEEGQF